MRCGSLLRRRPDRRPALVWDPLSPPAFLASPAQSCPRSEQPVQQGIEGLAALDGLLGLLEQDSRDLRRHVRREFHSVEKCVKVDIVIILFEICEWTDGLSTRAAALGTIAQGRP